MRLTSTRGVAKKGSRHVLVDDSDREVGFVWLNDTATAALDAETAGKPPVFEARAK